MSQFPTRKTIHDDYFESLEDFLNSSPKITKRDGTCRSTPPSVLSHRDSKNIIAIGDIHGDFDALLVVLYRASLINMEGHWVGGDTKVVQVGDLFDKGGRGVPEEDIPDCKDDSEWRILLFLEHLNKEAKTDGGAVFILIGNHEIMNFNGDVRYTTAATLAYFGGIDNRIEIFSRGGIVAQKIACMTNTVMRLGDWVFSHAGITPEVMEYYKSLEAMNDDVRDYILDIIDIDDNANANSREYKLSRLIGHEGVVWTRQFGKDVNCDTVKRTLNIITEGRGGLVVGHTVQDDIEGKCSGRLFQIDRGMSKGFGEKETDADRIDYLQIRHGIPAPDKMTEAGLKQNLKQQGLSTSGSRNVLQQRLNDLLDEKKIYIFVYGSLLNTESRKRTIERDIKIIDNIVLSKRAGFALDFCKRVHGYRGKMTALALYHSKKPQNIEGALLELTHDEMKLLDDREEGYLRIPLNWNYLLKDGSIMKDCKKYMLFTYYTDTPQPPNDEFPILNYYRKLVNTVKSN